MRLLFIYRGLGLLSLYLVCTLRVGLNSSKLLLLTGCWIIDLVVLQVLLVHVLIGSLREVFTL